MSTTTYGYRKGSYDNVTIHIYETNPNTQKVGVGVCLDQQKKTLAQMQLLGVTASNIVAKINGNTMAGYTQAGDSFYGLAYGNGELYWNGNSITSTDPSLKSLDSKKDYFPSFCIRQNGTTGVRWPTYTAQPKIPGSSIDSSTVDATVKACNVIIASQHPLVMDGVVYTNTSKLDPYYKNRFTSDRGYPTDSVARTVLGQKSDKSFLLVCTEGMTLETAANMMKYLGCENAVNLDGSTASQMRVADSLKFGAANTIYGMCVGVYKV